MPATSAKFRYWIDMTLECIRRDHTDTFFPDARTPKGDQRGPFRTARALGMALAALRDAEARVSGRTPFLTQLNGHPSIAGLAGTDAAVTAAAACAQLLRRRYPSQSSLIRTAFSNWLELHAPMATPKRAASQVAGHAFGDAVDALGADDNRIAGMMYTPVVAPYFHAAPPNEPNQGFAGATWGSGGVQHLVASQVLNFPPPPGRTNATTVVASPHYQADYAKVVSKGVSNRAKGTRSLEEEIIGIYWGYDGPQELGTPPRLYVQVALSVLDDIDARNKARLSEHDELDIVAMIGISQADAGIDAWHYKYSPAHMMWRPAVGIPAAVAAHGTAPQMDWRPLGRPATNGTDVERTPDFPAYPSGHATFGAAAFQLLRLFLVQKGAASFNASGEDNVDFDFVSDEFDGRNRDPRTGQPRERLTINYPSLWKAITDNSVSRVYLGVHWQFDGITERDPGTTVDKFGVPDSPKKLGHTGGVWLGVQIANQLAAKLGVTPATIAASGA